MSIDPPSDHCAQSEIARSGLLGRSGSEPGKIVAEARRHGSEWFVAVMNAAESGEIDLPLNFLSPGTWRSSQFNDVQGKLDAYERKDVQVSAQTSIHLRLAPRGVFIGRIQPNGVSR